MSLKKDGAFLTGNDRFEGYLADMLSRLSVGLDFDYEIRLSRDGKYGDQDELGNWDGMIGEVLRGVRYQLAVLITSRELGNL